MNISITKKPINYCLSSDEGKKSWLALSQIPSIIDLIVDADIYIDVKLGGNVEGKCVEVSRYLCDKINEIEPNSAITVCCRGFWRNSKFKKNDLNAYQAHQFVLYKNKYFIDMTLKQFDINLPCPLIRTVEQGHIGCYKEICQTYPEITDLNYKGLNI